MAPSTKTYVATPTDRERDWLLIDAEGKTLGRLATQVADLLRGKRKPQYTPHIDTGDFDRGERREDPRDGQQARRQALLPSLRLPWRSALAKPRGAAGAAAGGDHQARRQ